MADDAVIRYVLQMSSRHFGKYRGIVTDNQDPRALGRLKAKVPELLGGEETGWALPCAPYAGDSAGLFAIPEVGAGVWIEFEAGDLARPIWTGTWWPSGKVPDSAKPEQKVFKTKAGHTVTLDDEAETITIKDKGEATIVFEKGAITITDKDGATITISKGAVTLADKDGAKLSLESGEIKLTGKGGGAIKLTSGGIEIGKSASKVKLDGAKVTVNDGALEVM
jgi:uncharacterized protein involved in type VI secretion and phage assembly